MRLQEIRRLEGTITLKSGLHIGSGNVEMRIGGTDSPVVKHPHTLEPYIPGSSLKGKVRSLLEMESGLMIYTEGSVVSGETLKKVAKDQSIGQSLKGELLKKCENILKIFGSSGADKEDEMGFGPTRVSFTDCYLDNAWKEKARNNRLLLTEVKSENVIDRIRGTANPRFIERVHEGTKFSFLITFKVLENDDEFLFDDVLLKGLKLLEMDTLGGNGSRGYGRVSFEFYDNMINERFKALSPFIEEKKA